MRMVDVAIVGGGPAGMSAALWCADLGLDTLLIERSVGLGGQLANIFNPITNYLGATAANGDELRARFLDSIRDSKFERLMETHVTNIDPASMSIHLGDGSETKSKAIVLATGVRRRHLDIPGENEFRGKGILESGARDRQLTLGKRVMIVGGGDAAMENALLLSEFATEVLVAFRRKEPTARSEFVESARGRNNIRLLSDTVVTTISGNAKIESAELKNIRDDHTSREAVDAVLIRIGVEPNSELLDGKVELDERGYVVVNGLAETDLSGIFAVGDVANPIAPTLNTAAGTGATAAKSAFSYIETLRTGSNR